MVLQMGNEARKLSPRAFSISHHGAQDERGQFRPSSLQLPWKPPKQHSRMAPIFLLVTAGPCTSGKLKALKMLLSFTANNPWRTSSLEYRTLEATTYMQPQVWESGSPCREGLCRAEPWRGHPGNSCSTAMCSSPFHRYFYRRWQLSHCTAPIPWEARNSWSTTKGLWCQYQFSQPWTVNSQKGKQRANKCIKNVPSISNSGKCLLKQQWATNLYLLNQQQIHI